MMEVVYRGWRIGRFRMVRQSCPLYKLDAENQMELDPNGKPIILGYKFNYAVALEARPEGCYQYPGLPPKIGALRPVLEKFDEEQYEQAVIQATDHLKRDIDRMMEIGEY